VEANSFQRNEGESEIVRSTCWSPPGCHGGCGVLLQIQEGRIAGVRGDKDSGFNRGQLCVRGRNISETLYHPNRLTRPLIRIGKRGENKWEQIPFEEAAGVIADKLQTIKSNFGAESVIFCKGTARDIGGYLPRLCYGFGSPNYFGFGPGSGNACFRPRSAVSTAVTGGMPVPDLGQFTSPADAGSPDNSPKCIIVWGANPEISHPDGMHGSWLREALRNGAKLIVVDPRKSRLADEADVWLRIRPGTDGALALGFINQLVERDLCDREYVRDNIRGEDIVAESSQYYSPEKVAALTGIDPADLTEAVKLFAGSKPAAMIWGVGIEMNPGCADTIRSLIAIMALTGNIDCPGGWLLPGEPWGVKRRGDSLDDFPEINKRPIGTGEYPLTGIGNPYGQPDVLLDQMESGIPYPIKAAWIQTAGIIPAGFADPERVKKLFRALDFNVITDVFLTPAIMEFADVVLPAAMYPEKDSIYVQSSGLGAVNKAVEPPGECRSDAEIIRVIGKKIAAEHFPWDSIEEWLDDRLKPSGMNFRELREKGYLPAEYEYGKYAAGDGRKADFPTPSGRIELDSSILRKCGVPDQIEYIDYVEKYQEECGKNEYPFVLTTGVRKSYYFGSEHRNIPSLRKRQPDPLVTIHPQDAVLKGITGGDQVRIYSPFGSCVMTANIGGDFDQGVVHCDYGWWYPEKIQVKGEQFGMRDSNVNALLPSGLQGPAGFGYPFRCFVCNIEKAGFDR